MSLLLGVVSQEVSVPSGRGSWHLLDMVRPGVIGRPAKGLEAFATSGQYELRGLIIPCAAGLQLTSSAAPRQDQLKCTHAL